MKKLQGFTILFTGLSGSGKSTLATTLSAELNRHNINVTVLDGDSIRNTILSDLGFSRKDRVKSILHLGYIASEITKHSGVSICAIIAPYESAREKMREMVEKHGVFIEIYLSTPIETCKKRDVKGLYKKVTAGKIKNFTGVDSPYEVPIKPDITINTENIDVNSSIIKILSFIKSKGCLGENSSTLCG